MRVAVRVRPGASRTAVGGRYGAADQRAGDELVVAVSARAVDGAATEAVRKALADAFGVRPQAVTLVTGATSRSKVFEIHTPEGGEPDFAARLTALLDR